VTTRDQTVRRLVTVAALLVLCGGAALVAQMPDLRQMSGQPLPSGELPTGSISVRVVRQTIANNVSGVAVELIPAEGTATALKSMATDAGGRAVFADAPPGATLRATTTVDGERLVSQPFTVPTSGGLRILLAAGLSAQGGQANAPAGAPAQPAAPGSIVLGGQSRMVVELAEGSIEVFCLFDIVNPTGHAVTLPSPIVFEAPADATNAAALEGSSPLIKVEGSRGSVVGPLPPGATSVQFAYRVPASSSSLQVRQVLPLAASQLTVIVRKLGDLTVTLNPERGRREAPIEGRTYLVLNGGSVAPGGAVEVSIDGLPAHPRWPRVVALSLAALVLVVGVWALASGASPDARDEQRLRADRAERFDELVALERRLAKKSAPEPGAIDRRARLLEEIVELDLAIETTSAVGAALPAGSPSEAAPAAARTSAVQ
jgi:hypothetical protein